jgi:hypothetical protein
MLPPSSVVWSEFRFLPEFTLKVFKGLPLTLDRLTRNLLSLSDILVIILAGLLVSERDVWPTSIVSW